jgi:hypothetical protein
MSLNFVAGSAFPTAAQVTTLLGTTIGNATPNELEILLHLVSRGVQPGSPATQATMSTVLSGYTQP